MQAYKKLLEPAAVASACDGGPYLNEEIAASHAISAKRQADALERIANLIEEARLAELVRL